MHSRKIAASLLRARSAQPGSTRDGVLRGLRNGLAVGIALAALYAAGTAAAAADHYRTAILLTSDEAFFGVTAAALIASCAWSAYRRRRPLR